MGMIIEWIQEVLPGVEVHSVQLGATEEDDRNSGFFGLVNNQIDETCAKINEVPFLSHGYNAIGFSQGGLFLRGLAQRCNHLGNAKMRSLITFGSPHMGVSDAPGCLNSTDLNCGIMRNLIRAGGYLSWVQGRSVQAQYYKDPKNMGLYRERSLFLAGINNEVEGKREEIYRQNLVGLRKLVAIRFSEEGTAVPGESSWFGFYEENMELVTMRETQGYKEDWIGLRTLDEAGKLTFGVADGKHMKISKEHIQELILEHFVAGSVDNDDDNDAIFTGDAIGSSRQKILA
ncbi:Palmitoyl-protein thioesterase 1 [Irineochytrium annulatum]|nr:Palmitoyl-protein thioesterase 1 [Irineochytrium annulatum]